MVKYNHTKHVPGEIASKTLDGEFEVIIKYKEKLQYNNYVPEVKKFRIYKRCFMTYQEIA
uniref:Uncharacterized protein n=1 Tax=Arion vulgaris TaxID=1028688 RepID=A0A0B7BZ03_9EUPU